MITIKKSKKNKKRKKSNNLKKSKKSIQKKAYNKTNKNNKNKKTYKTYKTNKNNNQKNAKKGLVNILSKLDLRPYYNKKILPYFKELNAKIKNSVKILFDKTKNLFDKITAKLNIYQEKFLNKSKSYCDKLRNHFNKMILLLKKLNRKIKQIIKKIIVHLNKNKANWVVLFIMFMFFCSAFILNIFGNREYELAHTYKIGILRTENNSDYTEIYDSFVDGIEMYGTSKGLFINFLDLNANGNDYYSKAYAEQLANSDCDVILTIGSKASIYLNMVNNNDLPVIFAGVTNPKSDNLVESNSTPNGNFSGVSDYTPCFEQIKLIKELFPECNVIGTTYDATNKNSVTQINIAKIQAEELGITFKTYPIYIESQIDSIIQTMSSENDVVYLTNDSVTMKNFDKISDYFISQKKPIICTKANMVEKGCLATFDTDYSEIGTDACMMVLEIIANNADTKTMPVIYTSTCKLYFNTKTAEKIGYAPSEELLASAENI